MSERSVELAKIRGHLEDVLREVAHSHQPVRVLLDGGAVIEVRSLKPRKRGGSGSAGGHAPIAAAEKSARSEGAGASPVSLEEEIEIIARSVPDVEWKSLPEDLSDNLDHYIYGTSRR